MATPVRWEPRWTSPQRRLRCRLASVTFGKAWVEMIHRYLATGVGVLDTGDHAGNLA